MTANLCSTLESATISCRPLRFQRIIGSVVLRTSASSRFAAKLIVKAIWAGSRPRQRRPCRILMGVGQQPRNTASVGHRNSSCRWFLQQANRCLVKHRIFLCWHNFCAERGDMIYRYWGEKMKHIDAASEEPWDASPSGDGNGATRREFLANLRGATALTLASGTAAFAASTSTLADVPSPGDSRARAQEAFEIREKAALANRLLRIPTQTPNRDEQLYSNFIGNYTKGLPHNSIGEVMTKDYRTLLSAINAGSFQAFEQVPLGGNVKQGNPLSGLAFDLEGTDSHQLAIPAAP